MGSDGVDLDMHKVVYLNGEDIVSNSYRCPVYSRKDFDGKASSNIPCALLEYHEGVGTGATAIAKHRYQELLIAFDKFVTPKP
jgi:hypothetical protein